jgi:hypothetical protein
MKNFLKYIHVTPLLMVALCSFWSCSDEDDAKLSEAVLASVSTLNFEGDGVAGRSSIITIYADADWVTEAPEWITVSPASGNGVTDVTISVPENMRDGKLDNPRKAAMVFKGRTLASRCEVLVIQAGDKYRDVKEYTVGELAALDDETNVYVADITVTAITTEGFVASDEQNTGNVYVQYNSSVNTGDKVTIRGTKFTNMQSLAYIDSDSLETVSTGGAITYPEPTDITGMVDTYNPGSIEFVVVSGILNGGNISVEGASYMVNITDAPASLNLAALNGHRVTVKGYFAGVAAPVIKIMAADITDNGIVKVIYFSENFEWLAPWAVAGNAGQTVETDNLLATAPQLPTPKVDNVSALDALIEKGYQFLRVTPTSTNATECIYLQANYLKFGKTGYQAGIILPEIDNVPSDATTVLSFDWCPMRQGSGVIDPVNLIVIVANGSDEEIFNVPESGFENGHRLEWIRAEVEFTGVELTKDTKIAIRQTNWQLSTANRWFLDNIEITKAN